MLLRSISLIDWGRAAPEARTEETLKRWVLPAGAAMIALALLPGVAHAWTPGTHIFLGESALANLHQLPTAIADLLRAFPYDFLYGNIAADTSLAKKYAPVGRHCHAWHVGQEIFDLAPTDPLRAFGLGYLSHLAADTVAHNFFVPRQLVLTTTTTAIGHSYWESRFETHLGDAYSATAKDVILRDHGGERRPPRRHHLAHVVQRADQPAAVSRHGAPDRQPELAMGVPDAARLQPLGSRRTRKSSGTWPWRSSM